MNAPVEFDPVKDAYATPLERIDVAGPELYQNDVWPPYFERLRREDPVHWAENPEIGGYWSITKYKDIMQAELAHTVLSSEGAITLIDRPEELKLPMFIAMDPPKHDDQRKVVQPVVAPANLARLQHVIRARIGEILDELPRGETFNWVDRVSIELTTSMLATLFDFPFEDRRRLTFWSDCATMNPKAGGYIDSEEKREEVFREMLTYFVGLWNERVKREARPDLVSMLAHGEATRHMSPREYLGNLILLIVGGNDTTRNSISGGLLFLNQNPGE
ncbi:MAG: cytochrome P450, partial [Alphaproteobacteria bacterium]|nr:cytochrome P450 [Alphaproteobacteria bacterium]